VKQHKHRVASIRTRTDARDAAAERITENIARGAMYSRGSEKIHCLGRVVDVAVPSSGSTSTSTVYLTYAKMSRHRLIKKMNIAGLQSVYNFTCSITTLQIYILDELDDDALSDGGDEDLTPEQEGVSQYFIIMERPQ